MNIRTRLKRLEAQIPTDEMVDFLGQQVKASWIRGAIEFAEGKVLRPKSERNRKINGEK